MKTGLTKKQKTAMIENKGNLTITGNGTISFTDTGAGDSDYGWGSYTLINRGTLVIENGTIENLSTQNSGGVVHMYCALQQSAGSVTINGGTISTPTYRSVRVNAGDLTITGGNFEGQVWLQPNQGDVTLEITGGTFAPRGVDGSSVFMTNVGENYTVADASISGGTFTTKIGATDATALAGTITGGTFTAAAKNNTNEALLADGMAFVENADGTYGVDEAPDAVAEVNGTKYPTLADAFAAAEDGDTIVVIDDIILDGFVTNTNTVTLDLGGKTITGTDTTSKNFGLIQNNGTLTIDDTVGGGKITLTATINSGWNRYSAVVSNNPGATLTVNGGTLEHLGGTDMAYGIDSLTNGGIGDVSVTINGGTVKSTYRAVRQFLNSDTKENVLTVNGGTLEGANASVFFHDPSTKANNGTLTIGEGATVNGKVYLYVTEGSTEWPVTVSISSAALGSSEVTSKNVPEGYSVLAVNGVYGVYEAPDAVAEVNGTKYPTLADAYAAAEANDTIVLLDDVTLAEALVVEKAVTFDLGGNTVTGTAKKVFEVHTDATFKNGTIEGVNRCIDTRTAVNLTVENVTLVADEYTTAYGNPQPLTIGGYDNGTVVTLDNVTISSASGYGIITFVETDLTATDSTISGYNALYVKDANSAGSTFNFVNTDLTGSTASNDVAGNSFSTIAVRADNVTVNVDADSTVTAEGNYCTAISLGGDTVIDQPVVTGANVTVAGAITGNVVYISKLDGNTVIVPKANSAEVIDDGYAYHDNNDGTITVIEIPEVPTATVTDVVNYDLTFAMNFKADPATAEQLAYYGDWYADYVLTVNKDVTFNANGGADGYLSGQYDTWSANWVNVPFENVTLNAGESLKIMEYAAKLMGQPGLKLTYNDVYTSVKDFDCGMFFEPAFLEANPDIEVKLELRMYNPEDETESYTIGETYVFTLEDAIEIPDVPTATVTDVVNYDLTFAMNFKADPATTEQLAYYGDWYADYVLTVNKDVTFNANGGADGYLSGQYDEWSENWVNVPFENVTLNAGESLKIMEYAAKLMGQAGLKLTYNDVYTSVKDFDCGMFFEPAFLEANPDIEVKLELRMYNPEDETESYTIGETYVFTLEDAIEIPDVPTATVTDIENDDLTFAMNFKADPATTEQLEYYGDWYADYVLTVNKDVTFNANGGADGYLSGQYDTWSANWINVPFENVTLNANEPLKVMEYAAKLMGQAGLKLTYNDVYTSVKDFDCGVFFEPAFLEANPDLVVTLELRMYNNEDETESYTIGKTYVFKLEDVKTYVAQIGDVKYETLEEAFEAADDGDTIVVIDDIELDATIKNTKKVTLDLGGKTVAGTDATTASFGLIYNTGDLTIKDSVGDGKITLVATNDTGFNRYSSVISNNPGGKLTVESGTIKHLGGHSMSYAIDNLTNGKGTYAETVINGGTVDSAYIGIRQFLNGVEATNKLTVNGGTVTGGNSSIYFQDPSANANSGEIYVSADATIGTRVYLGVTAGSTEWPVTVSIADAALADGVEVVSKNVPDGYEVVCENEIWTVIKFVPSAVFQSGAYARYVASKDREHFSINLYEVDIKESLVVKFYDAEGNLLVTTSLRATDRDDESVVLIPYKTAEGKAITSNTVVSGKLAGSWDNDWAVEPTVNNVPAKAEVYADGILTDTFTEGYNNTIFKTEAELNNYLDFFAVYVAQVGDVKYKTIEEAIDAAAASAEDDIVVLLVPVTVAAGETLVLDLKGQTVSYESAVAGEDMITNNGNLTINDTVGGGKLTYANTDTTGANVTVSTISNGPGGVLTINDGTVENTSVASGTIYVYAIDNITNGNLGTATTVINGGTVTSSYMAIRQFVNGTACDNILTINGGTVIGGKRAVNVQVAASDALTAVNDRAVLTITDGTFEAGTDGYSVCVYGMSNNIAISGGNYTGWYWDYGTYNNMTEGAISGGTFDNPVQEIDCAEGYVPVDNGDGTYGVEKEEDGPIVKNYGARVYNQSFTDVSGAEPSTLVRVLIISWIDQKAYDIQKWQDSTSLGFEINTGSEIVTVYDADNNVSQSVTAEGSRYTLPEGARGFASRMIALKSEDVANTTYRAFVKGIDGNVYYSEWTELFTCPDGQYSVTDVPATTVDTTDALVNSNVVSYNLPAVSCYTREELNRVVLVTSVDEETYNNWAWQNGETSKGFIITDANGNSTTIYTGGKGFGRSVTAGGRKYVPADCYYRLESCMAGLASDMDLTQCTYQYFVETTSGTVYSEATAIK